METAQRCWRWLMARGTAAARGLRAWAGRAATAARDRDAAGGRGAGGPDAERFRRGMARVAGWAGLSGWRAGLAVAATAAGALLVVAAIVGGRGGARRLMPGPGGSMPQIIGFYENGWSSIFRSSFSSVRAHSNVIDTVLAFWYSVDGSGTLQAHQPNASVTQWVKQHGMKMGVLINNVAGSSGNNAGMITDPTARAAAVQAVTSLVHSDGYQEVNIDFEMLNPSSRAGLVSFMRQLRAALPASVSLSASVFPKIGVPSSMNGAYDYAQLAKYVNYLVIMLYDNHSSGGPAGPVSPWPWVVQNMNWFLHTAKIPASKLVLAAGVYGYDWPVGSTTAAELPLTAITSLEKTTGARVRTDATSKNPYFRYTASDGTAHVVWFQDKQTVVERLHLAQKLHLHGVAIWALGEETPAVWSGIVETWGTK